MNRRDWTTLAATIRGQRTRYARVDANQRQPANNTIRLTAINNLVYALIGAFKEQNPSFQTTKFLEACGMLNGPHPDPFLQTMHGTTDQDAANDPR